VKLNYTLNGDANEGAGDEWNGAPPPPQYLKLIEGGGIGG
jgi:hypothetical protein